jgi:hypothetical protein
MSHKQELPALLSTGRNSTRIMRVEVKFQGLDAVPNFDGRIHGIFFFKLI